MQPPMASLMAVFDNDTTMTGTDESPLTSPLFPRSFDANFARSHRHQYSTSTGTSNSSESSPTSTSSTGATDISPSVDSPATVPTFAFGEERAGYGITSGSPGKKPRNAKGLSLSFGGPVKGKKPPPSPLHVQSFPETSPTRENSLPLPSPSLNSVFAPGFVKPPPPRRKPGPVGLSLKLPVSSESPAPLRHIQSTPALSLSSPAVEAFPSFQLPQQASIGPPVRHMSIDQGLSSQPVNQVITRQNVEETYDPPLSQEIKSPSYPEGPVCIYDPNVYLYLEPTAEEASKFDVVFNVAKEVLNPFQKRREKADSEPEKSSIFAFRDAYQANLKLASENLDLTPVTATEDPLREPEYFYIPWDHNTTISEDLLTLVEEIDTRVKAGKKVLVHCQCGVSRSASLIIAYGIYKNPSLSVQQAYDAVKRRSRWIGPNMSLIYQITEFKTALAAKLGASKTGPRFGRGAKGPLSGRSNTVANGSPTTQYANNDLSEQNTQPLTAPLPAEREDRRSPLPQLTTNLGEQSPGPLSAPPGYWLRPDTQPWEVESPLATAMSDEFGMTPLASAKEKVEDDELTPNIFSPKRTSFGGVEFSKIPRIGEVPKGKRKDHKVEFGSKTGAPDVQNAPTANQFVVPPSPAIDYDSMDLQDHLGSDSLFSPLRASFGNITIPTDRASPPPNSPSPASSLSPGSRPLSRKRSIASLLVPDQSPEQISAFANRNIDADHVGLDSLFSPLRTEFGNPFENLATETEKVRTPLRVRHSLAKMRASPPPHFGGDAPPTPAIDAEHQGPNSLFSPLQSTFSNLPFPTLESKTQPRQTLLAKKSMPNLAIKTSRALPQKVSMIPILPPKDFHLLQAQQSLHGRVGPFPLPTPPSAMSIGNPAGLGLRSVDDMDISEAGLGSPRQATFGSHLH